MRAKPVILSVDDEPTGLMVRSFVLSAAGYKVLEASCGREALELFTTKQVDAVLLDYWMPEIDGGVVAQEMKRRKPSVPVIMVSGSPELPAAALVAVDAFLMKDQGPQALLARLAQLLPKRLVRAA